MSIDKESDNYKAGWYDGFQAASQALKPPTVVPTVTYDTHKCMVCGRGHQNGMAVICSIYNCPHTVKVVYRQGGTTFL